MKTSRALVLVAALAPYPAAFAQGPAAFQSPGYPTYGGMSGQIDRFTNSFNPAIGAVLDTFGNYTASDGEKDGFDLRLRLFELTVQANIDPYAWAYAVLASEEEQPTIEEAAGIYTGFDSNVTLKGGRFFVDFGKLMQTHVHDLRTPDRPLPLRTYLGEELGGDGFQFDNWFAMSESPVRYSFGVFGSLVPEFERDEDDPAGVEVVQPDRKQLDQLSYTGRITGFTELGDWSTIQGGGSVRWIPDYAFESDTDEVDGLANTVWGLDLTYQWSDETGLKRWLAGGELLFSEGDSFFGELDDTTGLIDVADGTFTGWYAFGDYQWNRFSSAGVQIAMAELPIDGRTNDFEYELYYTRMISEFHRLRAFVAYADRGSDLGDAATIGVQYTLFLGPHAHGINW